MAMAMERRGEASERGEAWREVIERNQAAEIGSREAEAVGPKPPEWEQGAEMGM